jgi:hypothetical protein
MILTSSQTGHAKPVTRNEKQTRTRTNDYISIFTATLTLFGATSNRSNHGYYPTPSPLPPLSPFCYRLICRITGNTVRQLSVSQFQKAYDKFPEERQTEVSPDWLVDTQFKTLVLWWIPGCFGSCCVCLCGLFAVASALQFWQNTYCTAQVRGQKNRLVSITLFMKGPLGRLPQQRSIPRFNVRACVMRFAHVVRACMCHEIRACGSRMHVSWGSRMWFAHACVTRFAHACVTRFAHVVHACMCHEIRACGSRMHVSWGSRMCHEVHAYVARDVS